ncbi:MAG: P-loop NTPase, partial [bacterium]|nr:P-loop NTPase [bacterium]
CYSYKGGSGRSTAAANIAGSLFRNGMKVACMDMDFGAPGLHEIIKVAGDRIGEKWVENNKKIEDQLDGSEGIGIHHFFNRSHGGRDSEFVGNYGVNFKDLVLLEKPGAKPDPNLIEPMKGNVTEDLFNQGELLFITASQHEKSLDMISGKHYDLKEFRDRFYALAGELVQYFYEREYKDKQIPNREAFDALYKKVYIICDSASGITGNSLPLLNLSNAILTFFRWSAQHLAGTEETCQALKCYLDERALYGKVRFYKIGSVSYTPDKLERLSKGDIVMEAAKERTERRLEKLNRDIDFKYLGNIPEHDSMKFYERIITLSLRWEKYKDLVDAYDDVADAIMMDRRKIDDRDVRNEIWKYIERNQK